MHATILKYFVEVAKCGSIRKAAQNLYVASSAVNRQILKLEEELGTELFDRLPNGVRLNAAGERVLKHVRTTLHDFHLVRSELDAIKGERTGRISIGAMDSLFFDFLPAAIDEFSEFFPAVSFTVLAISPLDVPEHVASGLSDIGFCFLSKMPAGIDVVASIACPPGVVMASSHPLASKTEISVDDCRGYPLLASYGKSLYHGLPPVEFGDFVDSLTPGITSNFTFLTKRLLTNSTGFAIMSKIGFLDELARGQVVWRPLVYPEINKIRVGIIIPRQRELTHVTQQFVARQVRRLKQLEITSQLY